MSDPTKDKYLELEKRLGEGERELAADITEDSEALDGAIDHARKQAKSKIDEHRPGSEKRNA